MLKKIIMILKLHIWDHPLENIIGALDRPVSTRIQLHEQALFCYYDAFLTSVEPKNYKEALTQACWIEAMQERCSMSSFQEKERHRLKGESSPSQRLKGESSPSPLLVSTRRNQQHLGRAFT
ncbi:hypothetical protein Tco_1461691 [Tanacetum coccineum]